MRNWRSGFRRVEVNSTQKCRPIFRNVQILKPSGPASPADGLTRLKMMLRVCQKLIQQQLSNLSGLGVQQ